MDAHLTCHKVCWRNFTPIDLKENTVIHLENTVIQVKQLDDKVMPSSTINLKCKHNEAPAFAIWNSRIKKS